MSDMTNEEIKIAFARLTRENRRIKRIGLAVATLVLVVMTAGAFRDNIPDVVKARRFLLVGENGKGLATLSAPDGLPALILSDKNDKLRAVLSLSESGKPSLVFHDKTEVPRVTISVGNDDNPEVVLFDKDYKPKVALEAKQDGAAGLQLYDTKGNLNAFLLNNNEGGSTKPALMFRDFSADSILSLTLAEMGRPELRHSVGRQHRGVWQLDADNGSSFVVAGPDGKSGVIIRVAPDGSPSLTMIDKDGKVLFQIPKP